MKVFTVYLLYTFFFFFFMLKIKRKQTHEQTRETKDDATVDQLPAYQ